MGDCSPICTLAYACRFVQYVQSPPVDDCRPHGAGRAGHNPTSERMRAERERMAVPHIQPRAAVKNFPRISHAEPILAMGTLRRLLHFPVTPTDLLASCIASD